MVKIFRKNGPRRAAVVASLLIAFALSCSESEAPEPPAAIEIVSGDGQYYLHGSKLPEPLVVRVTAKSGTPMAAVGVGWSIDQGGGVLSSSSVQTGSDGTAATELTLGPSDGPVRVRAFIEEDPSKFVLFHATASYVPCTEAETTLVVRYGTRGWLALCTFKSGIYSTPNETNGGIVLVDPFLNNVTGFKEFATADQGFITVPWDVAFSPKGELFFAKSAVEDKVVIIDSTGVVRDFALMEDSNGAELATYGKGFVVGCDGFGPFLMQCDGSLLRPEGAYYPSKEINNDALAVDMVTDAIYYISTSQNTLFRLPMDGFAVAGPPEAAAALTDEEASGANGMVCDDAGNVYILVDTQNTKELLMIDPQGGKSTLFDFFTHGQGDAAGIQRDLALDREMGFLYTLDTLNDELLVYMLDTPQLGFQVALESEDLSIAAFSGERIGLAVLP